MRVPNNQIFLDLPMGKPKNFTPTRISETSLVDEYERCEYTFTFETDGDVTYITGFSKRSFYP